jgi:outer membrane protein OmpA-like peptidoglycan-associated protein
MRYVHLLVILLGCFHVPRAQNLLANGSFEEENICTEYKKNCAPEAWICTSLTANYYFDIADWAFHGNHFVGLITGNRDRPSMRSFVRSRLACALRRGSQYKIDFYLRSRHDVLDSVGVYFSPTDILFEKRSYKQLVPAMILRDSVRSADTFTSGWKKVSLLYTATGTENFITIGSFKKEEYRYDYPPEINGSYYLYLDSVQMNPVNPHELVCNDVDSMKAVLYEENERHVLLERKVAYYRRKAPEVTLPSTTVLQQIDTLVIPDILFASGSARLNEKSFSVLDSFCLAVARKSVDSMIVDGHTDSIGGLQYNNKLSTGRATAVLDYILKRTPISPGKTLTHAYAYLRPLASNKTAAGRQRNRRVEIYLFTHE